MPMEREQQDVDRKAAIERFQVDARSCVRCHERGLLHQHEDGRTAYPLFHPGSACASGVVVVAEAPNTDDTYSPDKGYLTVSPDTDPSGAFLCGLLAHIGLEPRDALFTNAGLRLPAGDAKKGYKVKAPIRNECSPWLRRLILDTDTAVVVTLGNVALDALKQIERHELSLKESAGRLVPWFGRQLLPLYHPGLKARINRSEELQTKDIEALVPYLEDVGWEASR